MSTIALVVHHERSRAAELANEVSSQLVDGGHEIRMPTADAAAVGLEHLAVEPDALTPGLDLAVSLGGDGTMLRTVDLVAPAQVPILGVNVGQLGYLTEVEPAGLTDALARFFRGEYAIEERMMLSVEIEAEGRDLAPRTATALNEAVLEKTPIGHTVRIDVSIDGRFFTPYAADGLIVATPTGSTAYSFSARGPIVDPTHRALIVTPVSPHMLFDRTLVLNPETELRLGVAGDRPAALAIDGRVLHTLEPGDVVTCRAAPHPARLVTFSPREFHLILKAKFGLSDR